MNQRYNTPEFEQLGIPEFDPQQFAAKIRATYAKAIIEKLPAELVESVRKEGLSLGIDNENFVVLRTIEIMSREYSERNAPTKIYTPKAAAEEKGTTITSVTVTKPHSGIVQVYTDGACEGNPGPGGWSAIVILPDGSEQAHTGGERDTTNNRMELMAPITALESLTEPSVVTVYSDARYVVDGVEKGWARSWRAKGWTRGNGQPALNPDLWQRLLDAIDYHKKVTFQWVKGHAGNPYNERCDKLAVEAAAQAR